jgi:hypothetical protein
MVRPIVLGLYLLQVKPLEGPHSGHSRLQETTFPDYEPCTPREALLP